MRCIPDEDIYDSCCGSGGMFVVRGMRARSPECSTCTRLVLIELELSRTLDLTARGDQEVVRRLRIDIADGRPGLTRMTILMPLLEDWRCANISAAVPLVCEGIQIRTSSPLSAQRRGHASLVLVPAAH